MYQPAEVLVPGKRQRQSVLPLKVYAREVRDAKVVQDVLEEHKVPVFATRACARSRSNHLEFSNNAAEAERLRVVGLFKHASAN